MSTFPSQSSENNSIWVKILECESSNFVSNFGGPVFKVKAIKKTPEWNPIKISFQNQLDFSTRRCSQIVSPILSLFTQQWDIKAEDQTISDKQQRRLSAPAHPILTALREHVVGGARDTIRGVTVWRKNILFLVVSISIKCQVTSLTCYHSQILVRQFVISMQNIITASVLVLVNCCFGSKLRYYRQA